MPDPVIMETAAVFLCQTSDFLIRMLPGSVLALLLYGCLLPQRKRRLALRGSFSSRPREGALALLWMFSGGMAMLTLTPRWFDWRRILSGNCVQPFFSPGSISLTPFRSFAADDLYILLGNIVMFLPFGLLSGLLWRRFRWRQALLSGLCITIFIECWQLLVGRAFDIDDLLLNALGVMIGYLLSLLVRKRLPSVASRFQIEGLPS